MIKYIKYLLTSLGFLFLLASTTKLTNFEVIVVSALCGIGAVNIYTAFTNYFKKRKQWNKNNEL